MEKSPFQIAFDSAIAAAVKFVQKHDGGNKAFSGEVAARLEAFAAGVADADITVDKIKEFTRTIPAEDARAIVRQKLEWALEKALKSWEYRPSYDPAAHANLGFSNEATQKLYDDIQTLMKKETPDASALRHRFNVALGIHASEIDDTYDKNNAAAQLIAELDRFVKEAGTGDPTDAEIAAFAKTVDDPGTQYRTVRLLQKSLADLAPRQV